jgi:hypothetical protein
VKLTDHFETALISAKTSDASFARQETNDRFKIFCSKKREESFMYVSAANFPFLKIRF